MIPVNFLGARQKMPFFRQTFHASGVLRNFQFCIDNPEAEWQVVGSWEYMQLLPHIDLVANKKIIYLQQEPPAILWPTVEMLAGVCAILTPIPFDLEGPRQFIAPPCLGWLYGLQMESAPVIGHRYFENGAMGLEDLLMATPPGKDKVCSMVVSRQTYLPGHQLRLDFLSRLQNHFGKKIDFFGFGHNPIQDKKEAIDPYLYSIAIENSVHHNYWTEKIADVYLGFTMPIYYGAPNIDRHFAPDSMHLIDLNNMDYSIARMEHLLNHPQEYRFAQVAQERRNLLIGYNYFNIICLAIEQLISEGV